MLIAADRIWTGGALAQGMAVQLDASGAGIAALRPLGADTPDLRVALLMPGCTDLQVNGGGGVLFNADPTPAGLRAIAEAHLRLGTAAILPTVITDAPEVLEAAAEAVIAGDAPGIAGIHIEGPHIAPERRGTHEARFIRPLDARTMAVLARLRGARVPVLLTLAPELADPALLRQAAGLGVVISAGHSMADAAQTRAALAGGVTMFTHLYNAMPQMTSRAPGIVAAAILSDAWCGMIADGIHVAPEMLALAMAARPVEERCFLISDAMPSVGGAAQFSLYGMQIRVQDGALVNPQGALAGAHVDLLESMRRLMAMTGTPLARAIAMVTDLPRRAMRLPPLEIAPGMATRDLLALDEAQAIVRW
ncbi:N-acetylglucosamine-6-phosphate deacetylase [Paracoccus shanxieyensis]|uniref:Amidohydrolase family protein n=1 Tax=Paracoccus shanxieyensis TaxID=2675752 RepID=A0A6L6IUH6_9RHOB|nr:N-acetylglucosamine-6-phosphate deacetylase [Paracoccus shanxieyensis]MTH64185.1 amidohydrolase family protein [Paracoccus shanxieyensis]MTH87329.1 amidohydrolase family protein [Paracoccus shanxieyensis]